MKTQEQVLEARIVVNTVRLQAGLDRLPESSQNLLLMGISVALCWICEDTNGDTLQQLIDGEPITVSEWIR